MSAQQILTIDLSRGTSRVRIFFANALAAAAFGGSGTSYWSVSNPDGLGANPTTVVAVFAVSSDSAAIELAVEPPLVPGAQYVFACASIPDADSTTYSGSVGGMIGLPVRTLVNVEPASDDFELLIFGRDLSFDGSDVVEAPNGDLATTTGRSNWTGAIFRRVTSAGLPWDPSYGAHPDWYVNAPDALRLPLAGAIVAQAMADDRTDTATIKVNPWAADPSGNGWLFQLSATPKDGQGPVAIDVPPTALGLD